ncbi:MAG TPA: hypothetical protein VFS20_16295 [Longimicrobium sp.]|nr:hypothetical protein [Longimicrobium sp.]
MQDLYVRAQHDGREYVSVMEVLFYDADGKEAVHEAATAACEGVVTCGDMPDRDEAVLCHVKRRLAAAGIEYRDLYFEEEG